LTIPTGCRLSGNAIESTFGARRHAQAISAINLLEFEQSATSFLLSLLSKLTVRLK
jgi:hypothetical protein